MNLGDWEKRGWGDDASKCTSSMTTYDIGTQKLHSKKMLTKKDAEVTSLASLVNGYSELIV